eukprot:CAMPEP_0114273208 /NCGR_PEP_ID=MMETSP0058-20121206/28968_1 /TAXON_ID=36894 /ORGANISM="Pyramimonas parkeae, CCMP726" /LENGTH=169 /DNA_ID=CAMNT_0001392635 /DNA_START=44 /DNA_END=550 /DNA_ORIENTATION=-
MTADVFHIAFQNGSDHHIGLVVDINTVSVWEKCALDILSQSAKVSKLDFLPKSDPYFSQSLCNCLKLMLGFGQRLGPQSQLLSLHLELVQLTQDAELSEEFFVRTREKFAQDGGPQLFMTRCKESGAQRCRHHVLGQVAADAVKQAFRALAHLVVGPAPGALAGVTAAG